MTVEEARADLMLAQADVSYRPKDDSIDMAIQALENQKSIIEELENIKAEIEKLNNTDYGSMFSYEAHKGAGDMQDDIVGIIDKHIAELELEEKKSYE